MSKIEFWNFLRPSLHDIESLAKRCEDDGWDGITLTDSQNLSGDTYVALTLVARATRNLQFGPGVTNPITRHAAVSAGAISSLQAISDGRAMLGIGRGDSALFNIGHRPASLSLFDSYLSDLQGYLSGDTIDKNGYPSQLKWLDLDKTPKVPIDVSATGPKVLKIAARHAERITFALGGDIERINWALDHIKAHTPADRPVASPGLYLNVCVDDNLERAADMVRGMVGTFAHFSGMSNQGSSPTRSEDAKVFTSIDKNYEKAKHGQPDSVHAKALPLEFIERFALIGSAERCIERIQEFSKLGIDRLMMIGPRVDHFGDDALRANERFAREVIPAFR